MPSSASGPGAFAVDWGGRPSGRPTMMGREAAVASGHPLATLAAARILDRGGNAVDAGVAGGMALSVVHPDMVQFGGVAPIILHMAESRQTVAISGVGRWPRRASLRFFQEHTRGELPFGVLRSVVPAALDAWLTALECFGTMSFGEVAEPAMVLAREGFPVHGLMDRFVAEMREDYARWPSLASIFLPGGAPPPIGSRFRQVDLARSISRLIDAEARASGSRPARIDAARKLFYEGGIAAEICAFYEAEGGLLSRSDLRDFRVTVEEPVSVSFQGLEVFSCGPWCQGPLLLQFLTLVEAETAGAARRDSPDRIHRLVELMKLAFADREAYFGDPDFVEVPLQALLDGGYADERRRVVRNERAMPDLPPPGDLGRGGRGRPARVDRHGLPGGKSSHDTSYICVVDRFGNGFSATPSDDSYTCPIVPGLGFVVSPRGDQSWLEEGHPSAIEPWKRPRLTPNPSLVLKDGELFMVFGTPGGDAQCQAMLQVLLNLVWDGMDLQMAIEAPRFASFSFPSSFHPHVSYPGLLRLEGELAPLQEVLEARGHRIDLWPYRDWRSGGVCAIMLDRGNGHVLAGADPRRESCALAW